MHANRQLDRSEIVGHVLVEIRQSGEIDEHMVWAYSYFCLDSGVVIGLPDPSADGLCIWDLRSDAEPIEHPYLENVLGQRISDVLRSDAPEWCESAFLILENGYLIYAVMGVPIGLLPGVCIFAPGEIDTSEFRSIWIL